MENIGQSTGDALLHSPGSDHCPTGDIVYKNKITSIHISKQYFNYICKV